MSGRERGAVVEFVGENGVAFALRGPAGEHVEHGEVGLVALVFGEGILQLAALEDGAGVAVVALREEEQAAIVERHRALVGLALEGLGALGREVRAGAFGLRIVGVDRLDAIERLAEGAGGEGVGAGLERGEPCARLAQHAVALAAGEDGGVEVARASGLSPASCPSGTAGEVSSWIASSPAASPARAVAAIGRARARHDASLAVDDVVGAGAGEVVHARHRSRWSRVTFERDLVVALDQALAAAIWSVEAMRPMRRKSAPSWASRGSACRGR